MPEKCDPSIYYQRVRAPMSGWRNNLDLPGGLAYEGQFGGRPQQLYGETGAQSALLHAFDAALGIAHDECSWLRAYLRDMRAHMPPAHRAFLAAIEAAPSLRRAAEAARCSLRVSSMRRRVRWPGTTTLVVGWKRTGRSRFTSGLRREGPTPPLGAASRLPSATPAPLQAPYNECVVELEKFRSQHKAFAFNYIAKHSRRERETGTGGSDFMPALQGYRDATSQHLIA